MKLYLPPKRGQHGQDRRMILWVVVVAVVLVGLALLLRAGT